MINTNKYDTTQSIGAGFSTSVVNNNKEEMLNTRQIGHENKFKNNTIDEDIHTITSRSGASYQGDMVINGQSISGTAEFHGLNGENMTIKGINKDTGQEVSATYNNVGYSIANRGYVRRQLLNENLYY